jgi:hypothetical protein
MGIESHGMDAIAIDSLRLQKEAAGILQLGRRRRKKRLKEQ